MDKVSKIDVAPHVFSEKIYVPSNEAERARVVSFELEYIQRVNQNTSPKELREAVYNYFVHNIEPTNAKEENL